MSAISLARLSKGKSDKEKLQIRNAYALSRRYLHKTYRRTGESYAEHCAEVAMVLSECNADTSLLCVALLHDMPLDDDGLRVLEHEGTSVEIDLITKMHELRGLHIDEKTEDLDRVMNALATDVRLLPLRLAHRLNDVRHFDRFKKSMVTKIAEETLFMYSAIAGRMGMNTWRQELEDRCFLVLQQKHAMSLQSKFESMKKLDVLSLKQAGKYIKQQLKKNSIEAEMTFRIKGLYSAYRKMILKERNFEDLNDRLALRVIVDNNLECYKALGIIHSCLNPIAGKLKDYIGSPKENGYRSIHTVVYPLPKVFEQPIEIQIRTKEMHQECEFGIASHAQYKQELGTLSRKPARVNLFRNLEHLRSESRSASQFEAALRKYFREDQIVIFDTDNNLYHLQKPATALDFACMAYQKRCLKMKTVLVNGRKSDISTLLQDGDIVDIKFTRQKTASIDWTDSARHASTKNFITSFFQYS